MKTIIFNGSPRKEGDTVGLINQLSEKLQGDVQIINTYNSGIKPCMDCRFCWTHQGCHIRDDMERVYEGIQTADNIVIASPLYFSELTGTLLTVASRLQTYFCARVFRKEIPIAKIKKGGVIIVGGGDGSVNRAYETACNLLHHMNTKSEIPLVVSHNTNRQPAVDDLEALKAIEKLAQYLNTCE